MSRICKHCVQELSLDSFYFHNRKHGKVYDTICKECLSVISKEKRISTGLSVRHYEKLPCGLKRCNQCKQVLSTEHFWKNPKRKDGFHSKCSNCVRVNNGQTTKRKPKCCPDGFMECFTCDMILSLDNFYKSRKYKCKSCISISDKLYRKNNPEKVRIQLEKSKNKPIDKEKRRESLKKFYHSNKLVPEFHLELVLRTRIRNGLKFNSKSNKTIELLGCNTEYCKNHIQSQFKESMTWRNHGQTWEIDHIVPIGFYDLSIPICQKLAFNYRNLQPLSKNNNDNKSDFLPNGIRARDIPKIKSKQELLDLIQTWPNPQEFEWVKDIT